MLSDADWKKRLTDNQYHVLRKEGTVEGEFIRRWGATATYDWPRFFVRISWR